MVKRLHKLLPGGVDRPGLCLNSLPWPQCAAHHHGKAGGGGGGEGGGGPSKCGKHAVLRRYPFYLALENSDEPDYVSEKVFHALEAGVLPVYNGAPNVADFLPPGSFVDAKAFGGSVDKLSAHLQALLEEPSRYEGYFKWKERPLPEAFQRRFAFVNTHAKCRLCRWAYAKKYGLAWSTQAQRPKPPSGGGAADGFL